MPRDHGNEVLQGHAAKAAGVGFEPTVPREGAQQFQDEPLLAYLNRLQPLRASLRASCHA